MRRPTKTKQQRAYDKQQRALLRLRRAAVRYSDRTDCGVAEALDLTVLVAACDAYTNAITLRQKRRLIK